jgi:hypothetical protein
MTKMSELSLLPPTKRPEFKGGTWIAQLLRRMLTLTSSVALTGCLALDKVELPEIPDYPPSVIDDARTPHPSTGIVELDFTDGNTEPLELMVVLRDANLSQELTYRVFVDGTPNDSNMVVWETVDATGEYDRAVTVSVPSVPDLSTPGCHRVELIVTGEFVNTGVGVVGAHQRRVRHPRRPHGVPDHAGPGATEPHMTSLGTASVRRLFAAGPRVSALRALGFVVGSSVLATAGCGFDSANTTGSPQNTCTLVDDCLSGTCVEGLCVEPAPEALRVFIEVEPLADALRTQPQR